MTRQITMPQLGFTMVEGTITGWHKREGEHVTKGEPLLEVTTEKVSIDVEAPVSGTVEQILVLSGETVPVGAPVCLVAEHAPTAVAELRPASSPDGEGDVTFAPLIGGGVPLNPAGNLEEHAGPRVRASGLAKRIARDRDVNLSLLQGSGPGGRILEADVLAHLAESPGLLPLPIEDSARSSAAPRHGSPVEGRDPRDARTSSRRVPYSGARRVIGDRMLQSSQSTAQVTLAAEIDATEALRLRAQLLPEWETESIRLTITDLIVKACGKALREHPAMNSTLEGEEILLHDAINIGIAVALPDSLIVPVIRDADSKPLRAIATESSDLVQRARDKRLTADEVADGTFTVTNLGSYGIDLFTPIINLPEMSILGVGRAVERPAVYNGEICKRSLMYLSLTFDHRLVDGAPAAEFMQRLRELIERPYLLLT